MTQIGTSNQLVLEIFFGVFFKISVVGMIKVDVLQFFFLWPEMSNDLHRDLDVLYTTVGDKKYG